MGQSVFNVGLNPAKLVTNVVTLALEFVGEDTLGGIQCVDGVGQLDFVALARFGVLEQSKISGVNR